MDHQGAADRVREGADGAVPWWACSRTLTDAPGSSRSTRWLPCWGASGFPPAGAGALTQRLARPEEFAAVAALSSVRGTVGMMASPALAGILLRAGARWAPTSSTSRPSSPRCASSPASRAPASGTDAPRRAGAPAGGPARRCALRLGAAGADGTYIVDIVAMTFAFPGGAVSGDGGRGRTHRGRGVAPVRRCRSGARHRHVQWLDRQRSSGMGVRSSSRRRCGALGITLRWASPQPVAGLLCAWPWPAQPTWSAASSVARSGPGH